MIYIFDVDGTLTPSRRNKIDPKLSKHFFNHLCKDKTVYG